MIEKLLCFGLGLVISISGCNKNNYKDKVFGSGTIEATEINVSAKVVGRISTLAIKEGDRVNKGQLIAKLDDLEQAEKDFNRIQSLYEEKVIPIEQYEKIKKVKENFVIYAPVSGTVITQVMEEGEVVTPGQPIVTIADLDNLWVKIYISECNIGKIKLGSKANIIVDAFPREIFHGVVTYISDRAEFIPKNIQTKEERVNQVFAVKIKFKNIDNKLKIGMPCDVYIE